MTYEDIYSRFLARIKDKGLLSLSNSEFYEVMNDLLHNALSNPCFDNLFESIELDDDLEEITYVLKDSVNEKSDDEFMLGAISQALVIEWMKPKIDTDLALSMVIGGKEEKVLKNDLNVNMTRLNSLEKQLQKTIRSHGYYHGTYSESGV